MKHSLRKTLIILAVVTLLISVGVTAAYMFKKAEKVNSFEAAKVSCLVHEKLDGKDISGSGMYIGAEKSNIKVENTGNINCFIRIRLVSYFVDGDGNVAGKNSEVLHPVIDTENWIEGNDGAYYYKSPVSPGGVTSDLGEGIRLGTVLLDTGETGHQVVEVLAEAIQASPENAAKEAWGVTFENGIIATAP